MKLLALITVATISVAMADEKRPHLDLPGVTNLVLIKNKIKEATKHREKRQAGNITETVKCTVECLTNMTSQIEDLADDQSRRAEATGLVSKKTAKHLGELCHGYNETMGCLGECCDFPGREDALEGFEIMQNMCVDNYEGKIDELEISSDKSKKLSDWRASMPCFERTEQMLTDQCDSKCGGEAYLQEQLDKLDAFETNTDANATFEQLLEQIRHGLGNICNFTSCILECSLPVLVDECGTTLPGQLMVGQVAHSISLAQEQIGDIGHFPETCSALLEKYPPQEEIREFDVPVSTEDCENYYDDDEDEDDDDDEEDDDENSDDDSDDDDSDDSDRDSDDSDDDDDQINAPFMI